MVLKWESVVEVPRDVLVVELKAGPSCSTLFGLYPLSFHSFESLSASHHLLVEWGALFGTAHDQPKVSVGRVVEVEVLAWNLAPKREVAEVEPEQMNEKMKKMTLLKVFFLQQLEQERG